jgi:predicted  nucleic acid-binding Zn-ribbon protein
MPVKELERLADKLDKLVEEIRTIRLEHHNALSEKKKVEEKVAHLEKQLRQFQKEGDHAEELSSQTKAYKRKHALLKSKVASMLAKVEGMQ